MDGNRRWAKNRGLPTVKGHAKGVEALRKVVEHAGERGVKYLTVYAFSTENWQRAQDEVGYLMRLFVKSLAKYINELHEQNVRLLMLGSKENMPKPVLTDFAAAMDKTKDNTGLVLSSCLNYGGHQEVIDAVKAFEEDKGVTSALTPEALESYLYGGNLLPPLDLVIRTSGEQRLSGFMLWRAAYAEFYATETLWPDFGAADFDKALEEYARRQRRFGQ